MKVDKDNLLDYKDPGTMSEELLTVPGFVNELTNYTLETAHRPNKPLAFVGALAMLSHLTGTNYTTEDGLTTNLYLAALSDSGMGKDALRTTNKLLAAKVGLMPSLHEDLASGQALEDAALYSPTLFLQYDEADHLFGSTNSKGGNGAKLSQMLRRFYSDAHTSHVVRDKANKDYTPIIDSPHITLLATGIGPFVYRAMSNKSLTDGLLGRCLLVDCSGFNPLGKPTKRELPENCVAAASWMAESDRYNRLNAEKDQIIVPYDDEALLLKDELAEKSDEVVKAALAHDLPIAASLLVRLYEKSMKLALLGAISQNWEHPVITKAAILWGTAFAAYITKQMIVKSAVYVAEGPFDALKKRMLAKISNNGGKIDRSTLLKNMNIKLDSFNMLVKTLLASDQIESEIGEYNKVTYLLKSE